MGVNGACIWEGSARPKTFFPDQALVYPQKLLPLTDLKSDRGIFNTDLFLIPRKSFLFDNQILILPANHHKPRLLSVWAWKDVKKSARREHNAQILYQESTAAPKFLLSLYCIVNESRQPGANKMHPLEKVFGFFAFLLNRLIATFRDPGEKKTSLWNAL